MFFTAVHVVTWFAHQLSVLTRLSAYLRILAKPFAWFLVGYIVIIVIFGSWYWAIDAGTCAGRLDCKRPFSGAGLGDAPSFADFLYFSLVTAATVGFGDVVPESQVARVACSLEVIVGLAWITVVFAAVVAWAQPRFAALDESADQRPDTETAA